LSTHITNFRLKITKNYARIKSIYTLIARTIWSWFDLKGSIDYLKRVPVVKGFMIDDCACSSGKLNQIELREKDSINQVAEIGDRNQRSESEKREKRDSDLIQTECCFGVRCVTPLPFFLCFFLLLWFWRFGGYEILIGGKVRWDFGGGRCKGFDGIGRFWVVTCDS